MTVLVTGGAGFIGSNLVRHLLRRWGDRRIVTLDALTYAGHLETLSDVLDHERHEFVHGDIADRDLVRSLFGRGDITGVVHLAAETAVDRSIADPAAFVRTNVHGTVVLLQEAAGAWEGRGGVRFHHVSTDEVFGSLGPVGRFRETTPYAPRNPYAASKAAADHFVRAWGETHGLPVVLTTSTNTYGPYQLPEKLIPLIVTRGLAGEPVPIYGSGSHVRDWLYVDDHCDALALVFEQGEEGRTYAIGGGCEITNIALAGMVLDELDRATGAEVGSSRSLIRMVGDRPGHDFRYAMDTTRIDEELGWSPTTALVDGVARTVEWYLGHRDWVAAVTR